MEVVRLRGALVACAVLGLAILAVGSVPPARSEAAAAAPSGGAASEAIRPLAPVAPPLLTPRFDPGDTSALPRADVRAVTFTSEALARTMPYTIYLPPGYDTSTARYPVLYMLHGMSGTNAEWRGYGILDAADRMIRAGEIRPLIIVLPQGDHAYWVDHALPTDREAWGRYMAKDVVTSVDALFRTDARASGRAIGGVSMGAHGAIQLALTNPGEFSVIGAHSLVLRRYDTAPAYFGSQADWARRDPMQLVRSKVAALQNVDVWVDIGAADPWAKLAEQFNGELDALGIAHQWHEWSGDHSASYWRSHLADYLRFYDASLAARSAVRGGGATRLT